MVFLSRLLRSILYYPWQLRYLAMINDSNKPLSGFSEVSGVDPSAAVGTWRLPVVMRPLVV